MFTAHLAPYFPATRRTMMHWMLLIALVLTITGPSSAQNFVSNGTFNVTVPSNGTGGSWTTSTIGGGGGGWSSTGGNPAAMFTLNENGLTTNPRIEQLITGLTIGQLYTVTGDYQIHVAIGNSANSFGVLIDTNVILQLGSPGTTWTPFSANFVATSTSHLLALEAERNGSDHSYRIDNIGVFAAVPEPATWAMISLVMGGGSVVGWRLHRKVRRRTVRR